MPVSRHCTCRTAERVVITTAGRTQTIWALVQWALPASETPPVSVEAGIWLGIRAGLWPLRCITVDRCVAGFPASRYRKCCSVCLVPFSCRQQGWRYSVILQGGQCGLLASQSAGCWRQVLSEPRGTTLYIFGTAMGLSGGLGRFRRINSDPDKHGSL